METTVITTHLFTLFVVAKVARFSGVFVFCLFLSTSISPNSPVLRAAHTGPLFMASAATSATLESKDGKQKRRVELRSANLAAWDRGSSPGMLSYFFITHSSYTDPCDPFRWSRQARHLVKTTHSSPGQTPLFLEHCGSDSSDTQRYSWTIAREVR